MPCVHWLLPVHKETKMLRRGAHACMHVKIVYSNGGCGCFMRQFHCVFHCIFLGKPNPIKLGVLLKYLFIHDFISLIIIYSALSQNDSLPTQKKQLVLLYTWFCSKEIEEG